jgi:hypothetical protein
MLNLSATKISYIITTPEPKQNGYGKMCERYTSITHSFGYDDVELFSSDNDLNYSTSFITFDEQSNNNKLRSDALKILTDFQLESVVIKYSGEDKPKLLLKDGSERLLELQLYESDNADRTYTQTDGITFSFRHLKRYYFPTKKEDFKKDMVVELHNDNKWIEYVVGDVDTEWTDIYKLFAKYEKIRIHRE